MHGRIFAARTAHCYDGALTGRVIMNACSGASSFAFSDNAAVNAAAATSVAIRLTQFASGGGCACKTPPGELEAVVATLTTHHTGPANAELLIGLDTGDDAAAIRIDHNTNTAILATADFFTPVV